MVQPSGIADLTKDVPDFRGQPVSKVPHYDSLVVSDGDPYGQPGFKWDLARAMRIHVSSPHEGPSDYWPNPSALYSGLPSASLYLSDCPDPDATSHYPIDPLEGNDTTQDGKNKKCDIYNITGDKFSSGTIGQMTDKDTPELPWVQDSSGSLGDTITYNTQWLEFARLEINGKWYLVSDKMPNRLNASLKRGGLPWQNNGTVADATNNNF